MEPNVVDSVKADEFKADDFMVKHFNDPKFNSYEEGPGSNLPQQLVLPNRSGRANCSVYVAFVPTNLDETGIKNLCSQYGQVNEVQKRQRRYENVFDAVVKFASVADAENAIYNINKLRFKVKGRKMKADFDNQHKRPSEEPVEKVDPVHGNIPNEFHLPLATPSPLPKPNEVDNQRMKILLENDQKFSAIINGCASYSHSPDTIAMMEEAASKSIGYFHEQTQHFVHNATDDFAIPERCKKCGSFTMKFCKGCKDPLCSMYCLKEYNRNESNCSCVSSKTPEVIAKRPTNRSSVGRGAKLLPPRVMTPRSCSISSTDSDTFLQAHQDHQNIDSVIQIEPCELPKNNELVVITNVVSHKIVILRSYEPNDNERYLKYLNDVVEYAKTARTLDEMPKTGDIVLAEHDGCYYRALVARIEDDKAIVAFLELGSVVLTPVDRLKKLRHDLQNVQRFVFKVSLSGMELQKMKTDSCLIYLYELLEKTVPLRFISKGAGSSSGDVQCELFVSETNESVNGKLTTLNHIKLGELVMLQDIPIKPFDASASEVVIIDNSLVAIGIVTVAIPEHISDMVNMHQRIQEYCREEYKSPYSPRVNEVCLAKCNGQWYRAKLDKSFGDKSPVMFIIDFALFSKVHVNNMRRMPSEFKYPLFSAMAEIGGITDTTDLNKLVNVFPSMSTVSVVKVEFVNGNTDEPKIYFNVSDSLLAVEVTTTRSVRKPRQQLLEILRKKLTEVEGHRK
ncbi:protein vreteno-like [Bradysia coprophila]|uniref:protein vreteno-like n=1 Tax=Bradysia coprophila TaxID=38358 RepID=UPI00187D78E1|nr:protein vreteno-like [Bradysia coprophila]